MMLRMMNQHHESECFSIHVNIDSRPLGGWRCFAQFLASSEPRLAPSPPLQRYGVHRQADELSLRRPLTRN